jgi:hypothetical protein
MWGLEMNARLTKDERRAVAQRNFSGVVCALSRSPHERPQADIRSAERVVANTGVAAPPQSTHDGADSAPR